jgi:Domain of unknown function (DUF4129)
VPLRCWLICVLISVFGIGSCAAFGHAQSAASKIASSPKANYDSPSFVSELRRISQVLEKHPSTNEMAELRDSLPRNWSVSTKEQTYSISSEPLRNELTSLSTAKAQIWIERMTAEVEGASAKYPPESAAARAELDRILARPEFGAVRTPSAWELFRQRLSAWLARLLMKLFGGIGRHPIGGKILFWVLMVAGVVCIAFWLFRFLMSRERMFSLPPSDSVLNSRTWQEWIRASREAANRSDFREAVHSAYWAGIIRLEDLGAVPKDRTKTPREYLRIVTDPAAGELAARTAHRDPLTALTSRLERTWYANRGAGPEDFSESLRQLEALGCQLE